MTQWGVCATLLAPRDEALAFVAHHLDLGAHRIWLHFDDPDDPAADVMAGIPQVTVIRCDALWWQAGGGVRPAALERRQARNIQRLYATAPLPWIAHLDHDEFLVAARPLIDLLDALPADQAMLRAAPWEALHDPMLADDIFTARHFRAALRGSEYDADRVALFGPYATLLPDGVLSHAAGKCIFRTGIPGLQPRIHGAFRAGERVRGPDFQAGVGLLHFHGQDPAKWAARLPARLALKGYRYRPLQALAGADDARIARFYAQVQTATPAMLDFLRSRGLLRETDLGLRAKVTALMQGQRQGQPAMF